MTDRKTRSNYKKTPPSDELYITSWSALTEYIKFKPDDIIRIECQKKDLKRLEPIIKSSLIKVPIDYQCEEFKVFVRYKLKDEVELEKVIPGLPTDQVILALDHITDTRNLGAIIRSAAFFGVEHIIVPKKRQASLGLGAIKTCQGALSMVSIYEVTNLARTLRQLKDDSFWVLGADMDGEPSENLRNKYERVALVLGSEDKGMSRNIRETCDVITSIPGAGTLESLNVSVAAGILLSHFSKSL